MESTNRSGLQCFEHPREEISNFCINVDCLKPLCPDCVETHTKIHHQDIFSWKHCLSDSALKMKGTLDELRGLMEGHLQTRSGKTTQNIEAESTPCTHRPPATPHPQVKVPPLGQRGL